MAVLQRVSMLLTGLLTGWDAIFLLPVNRDYRTLSATGYARAHQSMVQVAGPTAPFLAVPLLLTDALLLLRMRRGASGSTFAWTALSSLCVLLNAAMTVAVNLPINRRFLKESAPPEDWEDLRDRWAAAHNVRTAVQLLGFVALIVGMIEPSSDGTQAN